MTTPDSTAPDGVVLIAYDGSANADHAIDVAGALLGGGRAEVVHAWEPVSSAAARSAVYAIAYDDSGTLLERERALAGETADAGVARARAAGFDATGAAHSGAGPLWQTIVERAEEVRPRLIVMGTRGLTGVRSALAGSVSRHVTSHAAVPVLTVPLGEIRAGPGDRTSTTAVHLGRTAAVRPSTPGQAGSDAPPRASR